jgi:hypothetical protein
MLECITKLFEILMRLCYHKISEWDHHTQLVYILKKIIHRTYVQHDVVAIYFSLVVDNDIDDCFLLSQANRKSPK